MDECTFKYRPRFILLLAIFLALYSVAGYSYVHEVYPSNFVSKYDYVYHEPDFVKSEGAMEKTYYAHKLKFNTLEQLKINHRNFEQKQQGCRCNGCSSTLVKIYSLPASDRKYATSYERIC